MVVTVVIAGSTLYYYDRVHKREMDQIDRVRKIEMDQIDRLMATGKYVVSCVTKYVLFVALN